MELVLVIAFIASLAALVAAQDPCASVPLGNTLSCYALRTQCHWDVYNNTCTDGAPASCTDFFTDDTGCSGATGMSCSFDSANNLCRHTPGWTSCGGYSTASACFTTGVGVCTWSYSSSTCLPAIFGTTCTGISEALCLQNACFWDPYISVCTNSLAVIVAAYECAAWTTTTQPNTACAFHGCSLQSDGMTCSGISSDIGNISSSNLNVVMQPTFSAATVAPNTFTLSFQVCMPVATLLNGLPSSWTYISIGGGQIGYSNGGGFAYTGCSNAFNYANTTMPATYVHIPDPSALKAYFIDWVDTHNNYNFNASEPLGALLLQLIGDISISPGSFDANVTYDIASDSVCHHIEKDINDIVNVCSALGATRQVASLGLFYYIPIAAMTRYNGDFFIESTQAYYINLNTDGTTSVVPSQTFSASLVRSELIVNQGVCPAGQASLTNVYLLQVPSSYGTYVGPRTLADIAFSTPANGYALANCYREQPISLSIIGVINAVSYASITTQTSCRPLIADGTSFNTCNYALPADKLADLGSSTDTYSTSLDGVHTVWMDIWACPSTANAGNSWAGCVEANTNKTTPDMFTSVIDVIAKPQQPIQSTFSVFSGFLPTPVTNVHALDVASQAVYQWDSVVTPVVAVLDPRLRPASTLNIDIFDGLFYMTPIDVDGNQIGASVYYGQMFPYMQYVPKETLTSQTGAQTTCVNCLIVPALAAVTSYDGFSIPVTQLRVFAPAPAYSFTMEYTLVLPQSNTTLLSNKFSLQAQETTIVLSDNLHTQALSTKASITVVVVINDNSNPNVPQWVNSDSSNSTWNATVYVGVGFIGVAFVIALVWSFYAYHKPNTHRHEKVRSKADQEEMTDLKKLIDMDGE